MRVYGVTELTRELKRLLEGNFRGITVRGEISEYTPYRETGHVYLTLKDSGGQLPVVFFRGALICQQLQLGLGSEVEADGTVTIYEPQGKCQLVATAIRPVGQGSLRQQFEQMRERLRAQGLFDVDRKKPIPAFPDCIGVVTSPDGAALKDFLNVLGRRHSGTHVRIIPTLVQGKDAAVRMARALDYINLHRLCDVIVITRGGGSMEDLWPFNEEPLAMAIARSALPVISAVGHERDFTICDFVADYRCATPSVAAEQVIEAKARLMDRVTGAHRRLLSVLMYRLSEARRYFERLSGCRYLAHPEEMLQVRQQRLDMARQRLATALPQRRAGARQRLELLIHRLQTVLPRLSQVRRQQYEMARNRFMALLARPLEWEQARFQHASAMLKLLGPGNVMARGYSILLNKEGRAIRDCGEVACGEELRGLIAVGELKLTVR